MLLVQLSDLHVSNGFRRDMLEQAIDEVNALAPDAIVITGDVTDNGILQEYERARSYIGMLRCRNIIMLAGNHDYRNTGYLLFKRFFAPRQVYENDRCIIATLSTARPDRDEGEVGYRQNLWLLNTLTDASKEGKVKIIAMHHHLIPIPDTGSDRIIVLDAGDVLQTALEAGVNLVLCGHKHRPWIWQLGNLTIAYAGTVSSERMRGFFKNTYSIVDLRRDRIEITLKVVGGESMPLRDIVKAREVMMEG
ncbi:MAG: metallophosphoesterase family protein [Candidatus Nitrosocaldus sp.]|nr:metallophosphoesterase [Candidatus Nitrosocaldus sp.]MDW8276083.1 metallophosphoesterase family protein [Candidatus Nitrosocaldus sp.]